jgi:hypothetical protein
MNNPTNRMKDPFYANLLFRIETHVHAADCAAKATGMSLNDSQVRSAILRAAKVVAGQNPKLPDSNARDQLLASLVQVIADERIQTQMDPALASCGGKEITPREWINALETVMDSIKTRTGSFSGSRDYLDFLKGFMEESGVEIAVMKETEGSKPRGIFERIRRTFKF